MFIAHSLDFITDLLSYFFLPLPRPIDNLARPLSLKYNNNGMTDIPSFFEDPIILSDAVLWMAKQPLSYTGEVVTIEQLREKGIVRPKTRIADRDDWN